MRGVCGRRPRRCSPTIAASKARPSARRKAIIDQAGKEAEEFTAETRRSVKEHFERRMKLAEEKIARAEADAVREVRSAAVDAAVAAAQTLIKEKLSPDLAKKLVADSIDSVGSKTELAELCRHCRA